MHCSKSVQPVPRAVYITVDVVINQ